MKKTILGILGTAAMLAGAVISPALGQEGESLDGPYVDAAQNGVSSIKVVKHEQTANNGTVAGDGTETVVDGDTISDVEFTLKQVSKVGAKDISTLDLSTNQGLKELSEVLDKTGTPIGTIEYGAKTEALTTGMDGTVSFANLPFGLFELTETVTPEGVTPAAPFYVTLPLTNPTGDGWLYDVVVYPKNTVDSVVKTVNDEAATGLDTDYVYTIETSLSLPHGNPVTRYVVSDQLDARLAAQEVTVGLKTAGTAFEEGVDYNVTPAIDGVTKGQNVVVTFTDAGFQKLADAYKANSAEKVITTISTKLIDAGDTPVISNQADFKPNSDPKWDSEGIKSPEVESRVGKVTLTKVAAEDNTVTLEGAEFQIFASLDDAKALTNPLTFENAAGEKVTEVVTDGSGVAVFDGIRYSAFENGVLIDSPRSYYLAEVKAPSGRSLLAGPVEVIVGGENADTANVEITIENPKTNTGFELPKTGAAGGIAIIALGATVLGGALIVGRRKLSEEK